MDVAAGSVGIAAGGAVVGTEAGTDVTHAGMHALHAATNASATSLPNGLRSMTNSVRTRFSRLLDWLLGDYTYSGGFAQPGRLAKASAVCYNLAPADEAGG